MKNLNKIASVVLICAVIAQFYIIYQSTRKPAYTIQQTSEILNRWQVTQADSVCYTGSISDCQAWIEIEKYRNH
jgi:hypothetical protein